MNSSELSLEGLLVDPRATARALDCADARESLSHFCGLIEIPGAPIEDDGEDQQLFKPIERPQASHHKLLIEKLEAVERGDIRRLMVFMPPGSAKSTYASVVFPVWFMGRQRRRNVIVATYASELARKIGRRARSILRQKVYSEVFGCGLAADQGAAHEWALTNENEFMGGGILSGITGNRADCLRADTIVETEQGHKRIEDLVDGAFSGNVLSYDEHTGRVVHRRVQAVARRSSPDFYRVHTSSGNVVECTGDHRVYTARGYIPARLLACGDVLLRVVRQGQSAIRLSNEEGGEGRFDQDLLRSRLPPAGGERGGREEHAAMHDLRDAHTGVAIEPAQGQQVLHRGMREGGSCAPEGDAYPEGVGAPVRTVRQGVPAIEQHHAGPLLLSRVQGPRAFGGYGWREEPRLAQWGEPDATAEALGQILPEGEAADLGARQLPMRGVHRDGQLAGSPHRYERVEQPLGQSRDTLCGLSHEVAWGGTVSAQGDPVALVERVCEPTEVFDIQVEGTHCFFADGILVHNCLIIDDPIKGRQEADSETIRKRTIAEYQDSLKTRLKPGGRIVLIQTRWHEDDLAGSILPTDYDGESGQIMCRDGQVWEVLCIPAQAEKNDPLGRKVGEMLWAEWFDDQHWANFRAQPRTWAALFQQRPTPGDGTMFMREWFRRFRLGDEPRHLRKYLVSDHAPTDGEDSDPNVGRVFGLTATKDVYFLDGFNHVATMDKTAARLIDLIKRHQVFAWFPEDDNNFKSAAPFIKAQMRKDEVRTRIEPISPHGSDKAAKAQSFQGMAAMGQVWIPEGPEGDAIIDQMVKFPAGKHDEEVDVAAIMGRVIDMAHPALVPPEEKPPGPLRGINEMTFDELMAAQRPSVDRV